VGQIDAGFHHAVEGIARDQLREEVTQNVGDLDGFPRNDGNESAEGSPAGKDGNLVCGKSERFEWLQYITLYRKKKEKI
jgi:hypothetical protein